MLKNLKNCLIIFAFVSGSAISETDIKREFVDDLATVVVSNMHCGYTLNKRIINLTLDSVHLTPADVFPGGKFRNQFDSKIDQITNTIKNPSEKQMFCNSVKQTLGAFLGSKSGKIKVNSANAGTIVSE